MNNIARSSSDTIFDITNMILITLVVFLVFYPLYFVIIASVSNPNLVNTGQVWLWPKDVTLMGYEKIFEDTRIWQGYANSLFYTIVGTMLNIVVTIMAGYALSRKDFYIRNFIMIFLIATMYFKGGLIPTFLVVKGLNLVDTRTVMIVLHLATVYNIIITRTFFQNTIPDELREAAFVDGCTNFNFFFKIVIPLSKAIIAVNVVFYAVAHWNRYFSAMIYLDSRELFPLQIILRDILVKNQLTDGMVNEFAEMFATEEDLMAGQIIKYGLIIVSSIPMLILYPIAQKYFVKGVMIGSVKG